MYFENQLHQTFIKPSNSNNECLFVLPVDDFDLNPHRCLELTRLIRILNIPRLFTLILGDQRIISHLLNLKFTESLITLESQPSIHFSNLPSFNERRLSHELSANAMRKLFAESNQIALKPLEAEDILNFDGEIKNKDTGSNTKIKEIMDIRNNDNKELIVELLLYTWLKIITDIISSKSENNDNIRLPSLDQGMNKKEIISKIGEVVHQTKWNDLFRKICNHHSTVY